MSISRRLRHALVAVPALAAALGGTAAAANIASAQPAGYAPVAQCAFTGTVSVSPQLTKVARNVTANLSATLTGCNVDGNGATGNGSFFVSGLHGKASKTAENLTGNYTIIWPASEDLNATYGTVNVVESADTVNIYTTVAGGAFTGQVLSASWVVAAQHNVASPKSTVQTIASTAPLSILENFG